MINGYYPQQFPQFPQKHEVIHVNGSGGAMALNMAPNSSALLLDDTGPIVWLAQTDGAGYKTIKPYTITPYEPDPDPDYKEILERISRLEEKINEKPHTSSNTTKPHTQPGGVPKERKPGGSI